MKGKALNLWVRVDEAELWRELASYNDMTLSEFVREMMRQGCEYKEEEIAKRLKQVRSKKQ